MSARFVIWGCVVAFAVALVLAYIMTEPGDGLPRTDLIVGTNGESDTLILTSHSATILPAQVDNVMQLWGITPVEFLQSLKMERSPTDRYLFREPIQHWITQKDLPGLLALADSQEPCASVGLASSSTNNPPGSTMGQEALFLLDGYRKGQYPPAPNSGGYDEARAKELKDWTRNQIANGPMRD
jgi:hypothetical protein